jgi:hypothetical protein
MLVQAPLQTYLAPSHEVAVSSIGLAEKEAPGDPRRRDAMKTMTQMDVIGKLKRKKMLFYVTLAGYALFAILAVLRVLTDLSEWWHETRREF